MKQTIAFAVGLVALPALGLFAAVLGLLPSKASQNPPQWESGIAVRALDAVLDRYPRAGFKVRFTELATAHCKRKPTSQSGWLDILCREIAPNADRGSVREEILSAPFAE